jgi:hypothetical protein
MAQVAQVAQAPGPPGPSGSGPGSRPGPWATRSHVSLLPHTPFQCITTIQPPQVRLFPFPNSPTTISPFLHIHLFPRLLPLTRHRPPSIGPRLRRRDYLLVAHLTVNLPFLQHGLQIANVAWAFLFRRPE